MSFIIQFDFAFPGARLILIGISGVGRRAEDGPRRPRRTRGGTAMSRRSRLSRHAGFSLLEVMMAVSIIAIALVGLLSVITECVNLDKDTSEMNTAMWQAKQMIENIRGQGFVSIPAYLNTGTGVGPDFEVPGLSPQTADTDGFNPHRCGEVILNSVLQNNVETAAPTFAAWTYNALDQAYDVTVRVSWRGVRGNRQIELRTKIGNY